MNDMNEGQSVTVFSNHIVLVFSTLTLAMVEQIPPPHPHTNTHINIPGDQTADIQQASNSVFP